MAADGKRAPTTVATAVQQGIFVYFGSVCLLCFGFAATRPFICSLFPIPITSGSRTFSSLFPTHRSERKTVPFLCSPPATLLQPFNGLLNSSTGPNPPRISPHSTAAHGHTTAKCFTARFIIYSTHKLVIFGWT